MTINLTRQFATDYSDDWRYPATSPASSDEKFHCIYINAEGYLNRENIIMAEHTDMQSQISRGLLRQCVNNARKMG